MRKVIIAFVAGQALQLTILGIGEKLTYAANLWWLCFGLGLAALVALIIGVALDRIELAVAENERDEFVGTFPKTGEVSLPNIFGRKTDMEEAPPLSDDLEVSNDSVKRAEK